MFLTQKASRTFSSSFKTAGPAPGVPLRTSCGVGIVAEFGFYRADSSAVGG